MTRHIRDLQLIEFHIKEIIHQLIQVPHFAGIEVNSTTSIALIHLFINEIDFS